MPTELKPIGLTPERQLAPTERLDGEILIITGAGSGLGRSTAMAAAARGATVVLVGRTVATLESCHDAILEAGHAQPVIHPMNLAGATIKDYDELASAIAEQWGHLDGIAHCAAHFTGFYPMQSVAPDEWVNALQVNVTAPWAMTRACMRVLRESPRRASVVFVGDVSEGFYGAYGIAKHALRALIAQWHDEAPAPPAPRMNLLLPGAMQTAIRELGFPGDDAAAGRPPDDVAPALLWMLSGASGDTNACVASFDTTEG